MDPYIYFIFSLLGSLGHSHRNFMHIFRTYYSILCHWAFRRDLHSIVLLLQGIFLFFYEGSKHSNFRFTILLKIEAKFLTETELEKIIIQRLLRDLYLGSRILQWPSLQLNFTWVLIWNHDTIVKFPPSTNLFNNFCYSSLLRALFL